MCTILYYANDGCIGIAMLAVRLQSRTPYRGPGGAGERLFYGLQPLILIR